MHVPTLSSDPCPDDNLLADFVQGTGSSPRRHAIEAHVDRCAACADAIATLGQAFGPSSASRPRSEQRLANRYIVRQEIGRGGMGTVHESYDPVLDRSVAIKVI